MENSANSNTYSSSCNGDLNIPDNLTVNSLHTTVQTAETEIRSRPSSCKPPSDCLTIRKSPIQVISYHCQFEQRYTEFGLLRALLKQLLQFNNEDKTQYEREQYLLRLFDINKATDLYLRRNLFLLNELLDVRFRHAHIGTESKSPANLVKTNEASINELILHILNKLVDPSSITADVTSTTSVGYKTNRSG